MAERVPWWKAFLPKKKAGTKDGGPAPFLDEDFDPFASKSEKPKEPAAASRSPSGDQSRVQPGRTKTGKSTGPLSDETSDDSHMESVFNEQTFRRNMLVSRSGRFKEKRKIRCSLPIEEKKTDKGAAGREEER